MLTQGLKMILDSMNLLNGMTNQRNGEGNDKI